MATAKTWWSDAAKALGALSQEELMKQYQQQMSQQMSQQMMQQIYSVYGEETKVQAVRQGDPEVNNAIDEQIKKLKEKGIC